MASGIFRTKSVEESILETDEPGHRLKRNLSALDLTVFGVGVIVGTGIFVLTGQQAAPQRRPGDRALVPARRRRVRARRPVLRRVRLDRAGRRRRRTPSPTRPSASSSPGSSAGTWSWSWAWVRRWWRAAGRRTSRSLFGLPDVAGRRRGDPRLRGDLHRGGADRRRRRRHQAVRPGHRRPGGDQGRGRAVRDRARAVLHQGRQLLAVHPAGRAGRGRRRWAGAVAPGAARRRAGSTSASSASSRPPSIVFFAYIGFDVVATTAEETRNPQRDMPRGILGSLAICAVLYMATAFVITGMAHYTRPGHRGTAGRGVRRRSASSWAARLISLGAICGITTVILVLLLGQSRVLFAMSRDRLLPPGLAQRAPALRHAVADHRDAPACVVAMLAGVRAAVEAVRAGQHRHAVRVRRGRRSA